jgi:FSR family fosmidomycin resistance protein-like MFS transporter
VDSSSGPEPAEEKERSAVSGFILVTISHALNHVYDTLLPILYPAIISEFNLSYGSVGMLVMGYRLSSGTLQIIMGFLGRFVKKKFLLGFGMIWQSVGNALTTLCPGFGSIFITRTLAGVGASPQHPIGAAFIAENFPKNRLGRAMGLNLTAAQAGRFIAPFIGSLVLMSIGWRATLLAFSIPGFVVGMLFLFVAESKPSEDRTGQFTLRVLVGEMRKVLRNRTIVMVMVVEATMAFRMGASDFIPSYLVRDLSMTPARAGILFTVFLGSGLIAPYLWGSLSDRFGRSRVLMLAMGGATVFWYLIPYGRNTFQLVFILVPLGIVCQGVGGIIQAFVGEVTTQENRDLVYGIYFTLAYSIGSLSSVMLGYIADSFGFQISFTCVALFSLSATIAAYFLK